MGFAVTLARLRPQGGFRCRRQHKTSCTGWDGTLRAKAAQIQTSTGQCAGHSKPHGMIRGTGCYLRLLRSSQHSRGSPQPSPRRRAVPATASAPAPVRGVWAGNGAGELGGCKMRRGFKKCPKCGKPGIERRYLNGMRAFLHPGQARKVGLGGVAVQECECCVIKPPVGFSKAVF